MSLGEVDPLENERDERREAQSVNEGLEGAQWPVRFSCSSKFGRENRLRKNARLPIDHLLTSPQVT